MATIDFGDPGFGAEDQDWWRQQQSPAAQRVSAFTVPNGGFTGGFNNGAGIQREDIKAIPPGDNKPPKIGNTASFDLNSLGDYWRSLEGFDHTKLRSTHNSPKYRVGRVLSHFAPNAAGLQQALPYLNQLGIGTFSIGGNKGDLLNIANGVPEFNGVNAFDVIRAAGAGGLGWQWSPVMQAMAGQPTPTTQVTPTSYQPTYGQTYGGRQRQPLDAGVPDYTPGMYPSAAGSAIQAPQGMTGYGQYFGSSPAEQVTNLYRVYYHRDPSPEELNIHVANLSRGQGNLANIESELSASGKQLGLTPDYWKPTPQAPAASGGDSGSNVGYSDPSSELFQNEVLSRMEDLRAPVDDPFRDLFALMALSRVGDLQGDPYTAGEDAALRAKYLAPLAEARDTYVRDAKERMGARNMLPSSGLYQDQVFGEAQRGYERALGAATNDMAVRAIDEKQRRAQEALTLLTDLMGVSQGTRAEDNARADQILQLAALFPEMDERRLQMLLAASGEGAMPATSIASLIPTLGGLNLQQYGIDSANSQSSKAAWGQLLGYILNSAPDLAKMFGVGKG